MLTEMMKIRRWWVVDICMTEGILRCFPIMCILVVYIAKLIYGKGGVENVVFYENMMPSFVNNLICCEIQLQ